MTAARYIYTKDYCQEHTLSLKDTAVSYGILSMFSTFVWVENSSETEQGPDRTKFSMRKESKRNELY